MAGRIDWFFYAASVTLALAAIEPAAAGPITTLFDTGVDASGNPLANGHVGDPHYSLISEPGGTSTLQVLTSAGGFPIGPWLGNDAVSAWIGPDDSSADGPAGLYEYQTMFTLTTANLAGVVISGQWATDDSGANIVVNGHATGDTASGFTSWSTFTVPDADLVTGLNTIDFFVSNAGGPTGLRVEFTTATQPSVPEPGSLALLGAALAATGLVRRRGKRLRGIV